jgi:hypothetical protein
MRLSLEHRIFMEDAKATSIMMLDFFKEKRIPVKVSFVAALIYIASVCYEGDMMLDDVKKMLDVLMKGFPKPIKVGKRK